MQLPELKIPIFFFFCYPKVPVDVRALIFHISGKNYCIILVMILINFLLFVEYVI